MRSTAKHALWGAILGFIAVTVFATGEMLGDASREQVPLPVTLILAMSMGGLLIGAPGGAVLGALLGALRRKAQPEPGAPAPVAEAGAAPVAGTGTAAPLSYRSPHQPQAPQPRPQQAAGPAPLAPIAPAPERDMQPQRVDLSDPQRLNKVLARLDGLVGLEPVAEQVRAVANRVAFEVQRAEALGVERSEIGMHAVFTGPPGVGKTEVARVWGEVLCALGLLPTDRVVEVSRQDLVARHVGETAGKTRKRLEEARGGVFFLDEAYALVPRAGQDFGPEAVAELLAFMENNRDGLCVIVAGYEQEMADFLDVNPGLASRFSETIRFPAYDAPTLVQITASMAETGQDRFTPEALALLERGYRRLVAAPPQGWANARSARQMLDAVRTARAGRVGGAHLDREAMTTLTEADVQAALARKYPQAV